MWVSETGLGSLGILSPNDDSPMGFLDVFWGILSTEKFLPWDHWFQLVLFPAVFSPAQLNRSLLFVAHVVEIY